MSVVFEVGDRIPEWRVESVPVEKMKILAAVLRDPNPIHWDRQAVSEQGLGDSLINQGPINICYITNMLLLWSGPRSIRSLRARFTSNVFEGENVSAQGVITSVQDTGGVRLVDLQVWLEKSDGTKAVEGSAQVSFPL